MLIWILTAKHLKSKMNFNGLDVGLFTGFITERVQMGPVAIQLYFKYDPWGSLFNCKQILSAELLFTQKSSAWQGGLGQWEVVF